MDLVKNEDYATLVLKYIGEDDWSCLVYRDQFNRLWKDIDCGDSEQPNLYSVSGNEFEGEPSSPIEKEIKYTFLPVEGLVNKEKKYQYMMLGRLKSDCDYYLGNGDRYPGHLWAKNEKEHIETMKSIWHSFSSSEKPEWLTWKEIERYEEEMLKNL